MILAPPEGAPRLSFTVRPVLTEIAARPGTERTGVISVRHELPEDGRGRGAAPIRLRVYPMDWTLNRKGEPRFLPPGKLRGSCSSWLRVEPRDFSLRAGEMREVGYAIQVPGAAQGTFRTMLMFESTPVPGEAGGVLVSGRIGSTLYIQVGPQTKRARIRAFTITPEKALLTVENTGTAHLRLKGALHFRDSSGREVGQAPLPSAVVLPGEDNFRDLEVAIPELPGGVYSVTLLLDYGGETLLGADAHVTLP